MSKGQQAYNLWKEANPAFVQNHPECLPMIAAFFGGIYKTTIVP